MHLCDRSKKKAEVAPCWKKFVHCSADCVSPNNQLVPTVIEVDNGLEVLLGDQLFSKHFKDVVNGSGKGSSSY